MDKDCNMANGILDEMMELKPVVVKKTRKKEQEGRAKSRSAKW
jgi:hypothetical protein